MLFLYYNPMEISILIQNRILFIHPTRKAFDIILKKMNWYGQAKVKESLKRMIPYSLTHQLSLFLPMENLKTALCSLQTCTCKLDSVARGKIACLKD